MSENRERTVSTQEQSPHLNPFLTIACFASCACFCRWLGSSVKKSVKEIPGKVKQESKDF